VNQADAFLADILTHPDDDAPRLVYADWLEEQGDPASRARSEFIRVQYALAELPPGDLRRPPLEQRERDLLLAHGDEWTAGLRELRVPAWRFRRGFVEGITVHPGQVVEFARELPALAPLRELHLTSRDPWGYPARYRSLNLKAVAGLSWLEQITALDLEGLWWDSSSRDSATPLLQSPRLVNLTALSVPCSAAILNALVQAPYLSRLKKLRLGGGGGEGAPAFFRKAKLSGLLRLELHDLGQGSAAGVSGAARSRHLKQLEELSLAKCRVGGSIQDLAGAHFSRLRFLDLNNTWLRGTEVPDLVAAPALQSVETLDLSGNPLATAGAALLATAGNLAGLRRLVVNSAGLGSAGAWSLCQANLPALESLHLRTNAIGDDGLAALAQGTLPRLRELNVSYNGITARGLAALTGHCPEGLASLDLSWNRFGDDGVGALAAGPGSLVALDLSYCELTDRAAAALASWPGLGGLVTLNLGTNRIGDDGLTALARSPHLAGLRSLYLGNTAVGDAGVAALLDSPLLGRLEVLVLGGSRVGTEMMRQLRAAYRGILG
jgi:uncharacterized protein (TIGR02996 family)